MNSRTDISDLFNTRTGDVFIVGAGPSILRLDSRKLVDKDCIFVNSSAMIMSDNSERNIWLSVDRLSVKWSWFWEFVLTKKCVKLVGDDFLKYEDMLAKHSFRYFKATSIISDDGLCGVSSVPAALDLAIKAGYKRIFLFGIDHRFIQGKSHFWQFYPKSKQPVFVDGTNVSMEKQKKKFDENVKCFVELKKIADKKGVEIFNCAKRTTMLDVFQKKNMSEVI